MDGLGAAGGYTSTDIRKALLRSLTFRSIAVPVGAAGATAGLKFLIKQQDPVHWLIVALPVLGFLYKQAMVRGRRRVDQIGIATRRRYPEADAAMRGIAAREGVPELAGVGVGWRPGIIVSVKGSRKRRVRLKIGAPLLLSLTSEQLGPRVAYHLAVLDEPKPALTYALLRRRAELAEGAARSKQQARRLAALDRCHQGFFADCSARGWTRAQRAAGSPATAAAAAMDAVGAVIADFALVEDKLRYLIRKGAPYPSGFYDVWAQARRRLRPPRPGAEPVLAFIGAPMDRIAAQQWPRGEIGRAWFAGGKLKIVAASRFDYSWLLSEVYR